MSMEAKAVSRSKPDITTEENKQSVFLEKVKPHLELIAAGLSGVLILTGWLLSKSDLEQVSIAFLILAFLIGGFAKAKEGILDTIENKDLNVEMLMIFAAIGASIIGYWTEAAILIFIFALSGALETYTMNKTKKEISALMDLQPEEATLINNGIEEIVDVASLVVGDHVLVRPGERLPVDGYIIKGQTTVDESAITGESVPVSKTLEDEVFAGTVNIRGSVTLKVAKESTETLFQKIIELVQSAQSEKSPTERFIDKFEGKYVKIVLLLTLIMMFLPHFLLGWSWTETFYRAMILLVVASPCAVVASVAPATLSAISNGARKGLLFKGGVHLENLDKVQVIAFDKTGTLTKGEPELTDLYVRPDLTEEQFLLYVASFENHSTHPLAESIVAHAKNVIGRELLQPEEFEDVPGFGIMGTVEDKKWKIGKAEFVDKELAELFKENIAQKLADQGKTIVFVKDEEGIVGLLALKDSVRSETKEMIQKAKKLGIHTVMLTGDSESTAAAIAKESGIDEYIAECLPENKVEHVKKLMEKYGSVAMVGDGVNDAPALATSTVGIAMGGGTDVAMETADVVLMNNDLPKIAEAVKISKRMNRVVKQNLVFSIAIILTMIGANFFQSVDLPLGVIAHEGSTILVILNGLRLLR